MEAGNDYSAEEIQRVKDELKISDREKFEIRKEMVSLKSALQKATKLRDEIVNQNNELQKKCHEQTLTIANFDGSHESLQNSLRNLEVCRKF